MNRIAEDLERQGVKKSALAKELHKSRAIVTLYANNSVQPPLDVLFEIARILNVDPRNLIKVD